MVSWLTFIMGSPGNSIRNLREICTGEHYCSSPGRLVRGMLWPLGSRALVSSNATTPLQSRLHPCSG